MAHSTWTSFRGAAQLDPGNWYFDRYLRVSDDGGLRWSKNLRISDVSSPVARMIRHVDGPSSQASNCDHGDYDQVAIVGNTVHLAWSDNRDVQTLPPCEDLPNNPDPFYALQCPNPNVYYDRVVVTDFDADGVADLTDSCPTVVNSGLDVDGGGVGDGVDDACDTCKERTLNQLQLGPNPVFTGSTANRTTVSGQLDDDGDGVGNHCDFDHDQTGPVITSTDFNHEKASVAKLVSTSVCGTTGTMRCGIFDVTGAGPVIASDDFNKEKAAIAGIITSDPQTAMACGAPCKAPFSGPIGSGNEILGKAIILCPPEGCP